MSDGLRRSLSLRLGDDDLAQDIVQDVFVRIHDRADQLEDVDRVKGWIHRIAHNAMVDALRRRRPQVDLDDSLAAAPEPDARLQAAVDDALRTMLGQLGPEDREALVVTELEGRTQRELADRLGLSPSGAKSRVQRARRRLRKLLLDCCHFELDGQGRVLEMVPHRQQCPCNCD